MKPRDGGGLFHLIIKIIVELKTLGPDVVGVCDWSHANRMLVSDV